MNKKSEKDYLKKEWKTMRSHLRSFVKKGEQEDLKSFRVQVKKLRSYMILADSSLKKPKFEKLFKPVRAVFKKSGEVRDPFVNLEMAKEHKVTAAPFLDNEEKKMKAATKSFMSNGKKYIEKVKEARKKLEAAVSDISDLHINMYYQSQLKQIGEALGKNKFDDDLHECRSMIKVLIYNYELVKPVLTLGFNEDYMEDMQTAIGDWHDNKLAIDLLSEQKDIDKSIITSMNRKNAKLEKNISALIPGFYDRATTVTELPVEQID